MQGLYGCEAVARLINKCVANGFEYVQLAEGTLGYGWAVLIAPPKHPNPKKVYMNIVIEEVYLNAWSSAHKVRRCRKLSKALLAEIKKNR